MKKRNTGSIIGITTAALELDSKPTTMAGYVCAKHALRGMLRELFYDVSTNNISVNAVAPDFVETNLHKDLPQQVLDLLHSNNDLKTTSPQDVAEVFAYLCSEEGSSVTGQTFVVGDNDEHRL